MANRASYPFLPSGLVPCLHDGDVVVWDSLAIAQYLAERHPQMWPDDPRARAWARAISACWVRFAATGDPNGAGRPAWPKYTLASDQHLEFGDAIAVKTHLRKDAADLFERLALERRGKRKASGDR